MMFSSSTRLLFALASSAALPACGQASPWKAVPASETAAGAWIELSCSNKESEQVEDCIYSVTANLDRSLKRDLCSYGPTTCVANFAAFSDSREKLADTFMSAIHDDSVVARTERAKLYLQITLDFSNAADLRERPR